MRRIRWALLLVALGLLVPAGLLAWRALEGLALERAVRHQAVAERAFDEMERQLSDWLAAEEARPFEHYRFYVSPEGRSPLAEPDDDFVIGAFQIDPDGSVHTPMRPRDEDAARRRGDWPPPPERLAAIARVVDLARETWKQERLRAAAVAAEESERRQEEARRAGRASDLRTRSVAPQEQAALEKKEAAPPRQDPGTTRPLDGPLAGKLDALTRLSRPDRDAGADDEGVSVYSVLQRLNRGAEERAERKQKVTEAYPFSASSRGVSPDFAAAEPAPPAPAGVLAESEALADAAPPEAIESRRLRALGDAPGERAAAVQTRSAPLPRRESEEPVRDARSPEEPVRVALDPMVGRPAGGEVLLLYRTVLVGTRGYRQGLVLDRAKLAGWLETQALGPSGLSELATLHFGDEGPPPSDADDRFVFQHRFAEPFDALSARLSLVALPGVGSPGAIYALVSMLALVGAAGLFAVYRMVAVAVHFAERRSNFVAAVTHELKTPLTAIRMYAEMLRDGLVPGEAKKAEYYGTITDESERLSRLIDNVLEFSRLERGTREMSLRVGSLAPVVREAADKLQAHASRQGFALELEVAPGLPPVRFDRDALLQVLFNLVDNAMKYARAGDDRRVRIQLHESGGGVVLAVRDFGPGVSGRHLSRIFEPFYRGEDERVRTTKGTGIGLALVRDLAQRMGARVRGDNAPGGGFVVSLAFDAAA